MYCSFRFLTRKNMPRSTIQSIFKYDFKPDFLLFSHFSAQGLRESCTRFPVRTPTGSGRTSTPSSAPRWTRSRPASPELGHPDDHQGGGMGWGGGGVKTQPGDAGWWFHALASVVSNVSVSANISRALMIVLISTFSFHFCKL